MVSAVVGWGGNDYLASDPKLPEKPPFNRLGGPDVWELRAEGRPLYLAQDRAGCLLTNRDRGRLVSDLARRNAAVLPSPLQEKDR